MLKIAHSPLFCHSLPASHRFPMAKYDLIPQKLLQEGVITPDNLFHPQLLSEQEILTTHTADYWHKLKTGTLTDKEIRKIGLPMSAELIKRERYITHATYECALYAKEYGISLSTSGGTHHGFADSGEGFCILNDICVASNVLLKEGLAKRILILDLDVHQGNGNASLMADNANVFVMSMHGEKNYPYHKPKSDLDINLPDGTGDDDYLSLLKYHLPKVLDDFNPDFVFYQAGVDVLADVGLYHLNTQRVVKFEKDEILEFARERYENPGEAVFGKG
ncbi:histone deacetylase, partial [Moraxella sp.]|uniref:histone deacetylase family protein n=1 Tax=Moraxella sp. TaxID=479 RepID=UPI002630A30A